MASLKGIACNDITDIANLNALNLQWLHTEWCLACYSDPPLTLLPATVEWVFHMFETVPQVADVQLMLTKNIYHKRWYCVGGNEPVPSTSNWNQYTELAIDQMEAILLGDPNAKFALTMSSQHYLPGNKYGNQIWVDGVWMRLPKKLKQRVRAFHWHFYPQELLGSNDTGIFNKKHIQQQGVLVQKHINTKLIDSGGKQSWITEIGLTESELTLSDVRSKYYPYVVQEACDNVGVTMWAWYKLEGADAYFNLYGSNAVAYESFTQI